MSWPWREERIFTSLFLGSSFLVNEEKQRGRLFTRMTLPGGESDPSQTNHGHKEGRNFLHAQNFSCVLN